MSRRKARHGSEHTSFRGITDVKQMNPSPTRKFQQYCNVNGLTHIIKIENASKINGLIAKKRNLYIYPLNPDAKTSSDTNYYLQWSDPKTNICYGVITVTHEALKQFFDDNAKNKTKITITDKDKKRTLEFNGPVTIDSITFQEKKETEETNNKYLAENPNIRDSLEESFKTIRLNNLKNGFFLSEFK